MRALRGVGRHWDGAARPADLFDAKADALALLSALGVATGGLQIAPGGPAWAHPGRSATLQFGPKTIVGTFGEVHPKTLRLLDVKGPLVAFELHLDGLPLPKAKPTRMKPRLSLPDFQPVTRDFAFVVDRAAAAGDMARIAAGTDRALIVDASVFDIYEGDRLEPGKKSVAIAVTLQPTEKTLTDAEIEAVGAKIVAEIGKRFGATLRGDQPSRAAIRNRGCRRRRRWGKGSRPHVEARRGRARARTPAEPRPPARCRRAPPPLPRELPADSNCGLISATRSREGRNPRRNAADERQRDETHVDHVERRGRVPRSSAASRRRRCRTPHGTSSAGRRSAMRPCSWPRPVSTQVTCRAPSPAARR